MPQIDTQSKNSLTPWKPSTELSISMQAAASAKAIAWSTSPQIALRAARQLAGQWPSASPADPQEWIKTLAIILAKYPLGVVEECVDPACGLAGSNRFAPSGADITAWCDKRVAFHRGMVKWGTMDMATKAEARQFTEQHQRGMLKRLQDLMRGLLRKQQDEEQAA